MQVSRTCGDRNKSRDKYIVHSRHVSDKWGGEWPFNKDGSWKIFVEFQGSLSLFFFLSGYVPQSQFFHNAVSESLFFGKAFTMSLFVLVTI